MECECTGFRIQISNVQKQFTSKLEYPQIQLLGRVFRKQSNSDSRKSPGNKSATLLNRLWTSNQFEHEADVKISWHQRDLVNV